MRRMLAQHAVGQRWAIASVAIVFLVLGLMLLPKTSDRVDVIQHWTTSTLSRPEHSGGRIETKGAGSRQAAWPRYAPWFRYGDSLNRPLLNLKDATRPALSGDYADSLMPIGLMPPHPDLRKRLEIEKRPLPDFIRDPAIWTKKGLDRSPRPVSNPRGTFNALALLVQFNDNLAQVGASSFDTLLFDTGPGTLTDYFQEVSYGTLTIVTLDLPSKKGWYLAPESYGYYADGNYGIDGAYPNNARKLAEDVVLLADPIVNFSRYDNDGDGWVDTVFIIHTGPGAEFTGDQDDIWSHSWTTVEDPVVDGVRVDVYTMQPEYWQQPGDLTIGVFAHELGHAFGLPDLYDRDSSSSGVGYWGLMGTGSWNGPSTSRGSSPAHFTAWSKIQLGFISPTIVPDNLNGASIPAAEASPVAYVLWDRGTPGDEYFVIENRQPLGYDSHLPGHGLLIWHVDDTKNAYSFWNDSECLSLSNCQCAADHYVVALEQADGLLQLEKRINRGDSGDPYPGSTGNRAFTTDSSPNSSGYGACMTQVQVMNISDSASTMTADLKVLVPYALGLDPSVQVGLTRENTAVDYLQQVRNLGAFTDTFTLEITADRWPTTLWDSNFAAIISDTGTVVPGQTVTVGVRVEVPSDAAPGQSDKAVLYVTSAGDLTYSRLSTFLTSVANPILIVDDDQSSEGDSALNVVLSYERPLADAGYSYDVWDTEIKGSPDLSALEVYDLVIWFTGQPWWNTVSATDEAALAAYLDQGGRLFLSSQEYLYDRGLTDFGRNYLHIRQHADDQRAGTVVGTSGNPIGGGLGPYTLSYPYTDYSDDVFPDAQATPAFLNDRGNSSAITYDGGNFRTVFFAFPFEALPSEGADAVVHRVLDWLTTTALGTSCRAYWDEDANRSGMVDMTDVNEVVGAWHTYDERYDLDNDNDVDIVDAMRVTRHLGDGCL